MVHALEEAARVLSDQGMIIDVRPLAINIPLEIIFDGGSMSAGEIDLSPDVQYDVAADLAIVTFLAADGFREVKHEIFDFNYYWNTVKEMKEDIKKYWNDEVIITRKVWKEATKMFNAQQSKARIRVKYQMKLSVFDKTFSDKNFNDRIE